MRREGNDEIFVMLQIIKIVLSFIVISFGVVRPIGRESFKKVFENYDRLGGYRQADRTCEIRNKQCFYTGEKQGCLKFIVLAYYVHIEHRAFKHKLHNLTESICH